MIDIKSISSETLFSVLITEEAEHVEELMKSDHVALSWNSEFDYTLPAGTYIEYKGEKYSLLEPYRPAQEHENKFVFTPKFQSVIMRWAKMPFFMYTYAADNVITSREPDWSLTDTPANFMSVICKAIKNETGETWTFSVDASLSASATVSFQSTDIFSGLNAVANIFKTEWWADKANRVLHLSKAEYGIPVTLKVGENINVPSVTDKKEGYYTRYYAFGSTRNIVQDYKGANVNNLTNKRLTLDPAKYPGGFKDIRPDLSTDEIFSKILLFDNVYPKSILNIADVRVRLMWTFGDDNEKVQIGTDEAGNPVYDQYAIWYFRIQGFTLNNTTYDKDSNPDGMLIPGKELSAHFETGALQGREFELIYHDKTETVSSADGTSIILNAGDYEIKFKEESTYIIPAITALIPSDGDKVILFNIRMPQEYVNSAYLELEKELDDEMERLSSDLNNYEFDSNPVAFYENNPNLSVGQKVTYINGDYSYSTRVIRLVTRLDYDIRQRITIGNDKITGTIQELKEDVLSANQDVDLLSAINNMTSSLQQSYQRTQKLMQEGFAAIKDMWKFDPDNPDTIYSKYNVYSVGAVSALGMGSGGSGSGGGGGASYSRLDNWSDYTAAKAGYVLSAKLGYDLKTQIDNLPTTSVNPYALTFGSKTYDGSAAVSLTAADLGALTTHQIIYSLTIQKNGTAVGTYSPASKAATIDISDVASASALSSHTGNSTIHITAAERTKWNTTSSSLDSIMGTDSDTIINKWEEVVAFLDTYTEADTLANLLSNKADKTIKISAGTGLSGGGDLSANRTLSLAASGVTAGIYPKVTVDTYGRVTSGTTLSMNDIPALSISKITGLQAELDNKLNEADFASYFATEMAKWFVRDLTNKGIYPAEYNGENVGLYSKTYVSALGVSNTTGSTGGANALYELVDVLPNSDNTGVQGAAKGSLLSYDGTHWVAVAQSSVVPDLTGYVTEAWVNAKDYATVSAMNTALSNKAGKTIKISAGTGLSGGGDLSSNRTLSLKPATTGTLGGVIVGNGLAVDETGLLVLASEYSLPTASASTLGGVKVGPTLEIDANGVLNQKANVVTAETYPKVAVDTFGRVIGGSSLAVTDIPSLPWSKITSGKPTTLSGYGITNAYTKTEINTKLTDGSVTKVGMATVGSSVKPIYLSNGVPTACGYSFGNASGNAALNNGTLNTNLNADLLDGYHKESFDGYKFTQIDASELDNDVWYPVIFTVPVSKQTRVRVEGLSTTNASWNSRTDKQMAVYLDYTVQGSGWRFVAPLRVVHFFQLGAGASSSNCVAGLGQLTNSSKEYVMVRGGAFYNFYISHWITPVLYTSTYTANNQSISPVTTSPTAIVRNSALISDNVNSATKLQTARTINGTSFDGSASITTANWGTARNIGIVNSDGTGTAVTTSVNGSANVNLKLPATIKASLTGNASTATTLQTARTIALSGAATGSASFNGSANVTIATSNVYLSLQDVRSDNVSAAAYSKSLRYLFVANSTDSLADGGGYHSVLHFAQWTGDTGGNMKQLALTDNGNLYLRRGTYSTGTWTSWVKFLNTTNYASTLDSRYVLLGTAQTITGLKTFTQSVHLKHADYSTGGNAKMIVFDDYQDNAVGSFGSLASNNVFQYIYAGWGTTPWNLPFCLAISSDRFTYKNNDVLHVGNYTDTLDTRYALKSSAMTFTDGTNYVAAEFNNASLALLAYNTYIEFKQSNAGWFNLKAGKFMVNGGTSSHFLKGDGSLDNNSYATTSQLTDGSVTKIGTQHVGSVSKGIYLNAGVPTAMTHSLAATVNAGTSGRLTYYSSTTAIAAYSSTVGGTARPMYLNAGVPTGLSADVGHAAKPIFLSAGTLTACSSTVGGVAKPVYLNAGEITACSSTVGSASLPVYMSAGTLTTCGTSLGVSITGNAASATYVSNVRVSTLNPTSRTVYYLHFTTGISSGTNYPLYGNNGIRYQTIEGTTGSLGLAELLLGNNTTSGTAGNKYGAIRLYATTDGYTSYRTYNAAGRTLYLVGTANSVAVGSSLKPVYVSSAGVVTAFSNTIGSATTPVYVNAGTITNCSYSFGNSSGNVPISNGTLNTNLNANYLNGLEESRFFLTNRGTIPTAFVDLTTSTSGNANYANYSSGTYSIQKSSSTELFINFALNTGSTSALQLKTSYSTASTLYYRKTIDANRVSGDWSHFITSENIASQTVSKANTLVTSRTLWGQSFNGSANVSGALSNVGNITPAANATYSCGTAASRWSSVYASNYLYVGAAGLTSPNSGVSGCVLSSEGCLELIGGKYAYIDFHYDGSTSDYTNRIIEGVSGQLTVTGSLRIGLAYATSSSYKFYVAGTAYISSTLKVASTADYASSSAAFSTTGSIFASKNIYAAGAVTAKASSSDIRLKKDLCEYDALDMIRSFRSVKYKWNDVAKRNSEVFNTDAWQFGLIAQDLIKGGYRQLTSDVFKDYLTIQYERLTPVLWRGVQQIDEEITQLKKRIEELEKKAKTNTRFTKTNIRYK